MRHVPLCLLGALASASLASAQLRFKDVTLDAGLPASNSAPDLTSMVGGASAGDFDNDGWMDLFVPGLGYRPDMLFMNKGNGKFKDRARSAGVAVQHLSSGAAVGDYDGDGWLDIFVASMGVTTMGPGTNLLYHNDGDGTFTEVAAATGVAMTSPTVGDGFGSTFGDYDLDGDLDLFVCGYWTQSGGNCLFRNEGNGTFVNATINAELQLRDLRGFSPAFVDMNGDHYPELLLAADFGTTSYYINDGDGTFTFAWKDDVFGMGHTVGDFNRDGRFDWYVTSVFPSLPLYERNRLYMNAGGDVFMETGLQSGVHNGAWGWGTTAVDLDHDGWEDIVETNGFPGAAYHNHPARVFMNNGDRTFDSVADKVGLDHALDGLGLLDFDYDNDGDRDIFIATGNPAQMRLYRNDLQNGGNWLKISLNTTHNPGLAPFGVGTQVKLIASSGRQYRVMHGMCNYLAQSELIVHFGLGSATNVTVLTLTWPDGKKSVLHNVAVNQHITVRSH